MAKATYPACWQDNDGTYVCEMRDKKSGRVWGQGYGDTRKEAIYNARNDQPKDMLIKRAIGWTWRHPFKAGALTLAYMAFRRPIRQIAEAATRTISQMMFALGLPRKVCEVVRLSYQALP